MDGWVGWEVVSKSKRESKDRKCLLFLVLLLLVRQRRDRKNGENGMGLYFSSRILVKDDES